MRRLGFVALFALSLGLRALFFHGLDVRETIRADAYSYASLGWSLANRGNYSESDQPPFEPHVGWPPGYPLLIAPFYRGRTLRQGTAAVLPVQVFIGSMLPLL